MDPLLTILVFGYLLISSYFFTNWLNFLQKKPRFSPEEMLLSLVILVIVTILWPFVVPIYCLELLKTRNIEFSSILPILLAIFLVSLLTYLG